MDALAELAREHAPRVLGVLTATFGDLDLADDAVQDALVQAAQDWPTTGVPPNPPAWLMTVARHKAVDHLRRHASAQRRVLAAAPDLIERGEPAPARDLVDETNDVPDERLRLILLTCHPALGRDTQVALTLRLVAGLTVEEIGAGLLVPAATVAQRIVRAKRKIRLAGIPLSVPNDLTHRLPEVLSVIYLVFNAGYLGHGPDDVVRVDLADEAVRLARLLHRRLPSETEVAGLLALLLYHRSRFDARLDPAGDLVLLVDQDRTAWDRAAIAEADRVLDDAIARLQPGVYQLQALIASHHAHARTPQDTDWRAVAALYGQLVAMTGSPVVGLNRAVAVAMADGPSAGLEMADAVDGLDDYHLWHATRADLLRRTGRRTEALAAYRRAADLTANPAERRFLAARIRELE